MNALDTWKPSSLALSSALEEEKSIINYHIQVAQPEFQEIDVQLRRYLTNFTRQPSTKKKKLWPLITAWFVFASWFISTQNFTFHWLPTINNFFSVQSSQCIGQTKRKVAKRSDWSERMQKLREAKGTSGCWLHGVSKSLSIIESIWPSFTNTLTLP